MASLISPDQIARLREEQTGVLELRLQELEVCEYFGIIFSPKGIASLTKQDITGFMRFENNKRWREISRENVTANMDKLRQALSVLVDESISVAKRLNKLEPGRGKLAVAHLGKAKMTAILLVSHPKLYGTWNDYSERALEKMGLMPEFKAGWHLGEQYEAVNRVLVGLAAEYQVSLWWLDLILEKISRLVR